MKKYCLITAITVNLLIFSSRIQGQTTQTPLDQLKSMEQFLGTWQQDVGKDTIYVWEFQKSGKAIFANTYNVIKNQKQPPTIVCYGFDSKLNKFKGYTLMANGSYATWIASFTSQRVFHVEAVQDFNPEIIFQKIDCVFENPNQWTMTSFNKDGVKVAEVKNNKVTK